MADMEKVIKGLECCDCDLDHAYFNSCFKCPYEEDNQCGGMGLCTSLLAHDALALLKAQDTVEHALSVLKAHGWKENKTVSTYCPNCGAYVEVKRDKRP